MVWLARAMGIFFLCIGIAFVHRPEWTEVVISFLEKGKRIYLVGFVRLLCGVVLLVAATQCRKTAVIVALGVLFLLSGIVVFTLGPRRIRPFLDWWKERSLFWKRLLCLLILAFGALILYAA